jgi:glucose-1-phosphate adenylyltransferase
MFLEDNRTMVAYPFKGYWKDVGTVESLWEANMDLLSDNPPFNMNDRGWRVYSQNPNQPPQYIASTANVKNSLINEGCVIFGEIDHSVIFFGVNVGKNTQIKDSVIMPNVKIGSDVKIYRAIIGEGCIIADGVTIGDPNATETLLIGNNEIITE